MPRFAANLTLMFTEWPFLDRFAAAADAGFAAVEFLFPYDHDPQAIAHRLGSNRLAHALFNMPPGDLDRGERGLAALPERFAEVAAGVDTALRYAEATGARHIHLMAGIADPRDPAAEAAYRRSVAHAAERLAERGLTLMIEPISRRSMPGYFLDDFDRAAALIGDLGLPNLRLQFDIFHRQILHGDVAVALRQMMPIIGHVQIASVPSRNEPDGEELNFTYLFAQLDRLGYAGFVGCEYNPRGPTREGLAWFERYRRRD